MSESSERGRAYELKIEKVTRRKLHLEVKRDSRSGAGDLHKQDVRDRYNELPICIEVKNQETLKIKEWWRDADAKASFNQAAIVVFPMDEEDLAIIRYTDLLQIIKELFDWRETAEDLQQPVSVLDKPKKHTLEEAKAEANSMAVEATERKVEREELKTCPNHHIIARGNKCQWKGCKFSTTYVKKKAKK